MRQLTIDHKKYVLLPKESFQELQKTAALKHTPEKTFTVAEARSHSKKLIKKWASKK